MKGLFPQFDPGAKVDYKAVWEEACFVFDTNVLLNLYRYQVKTRDQLLEVLGKLSEQIWIPHHVALEFQRNRLEIIADQNRRFSEVHDVIDKAEKNLKSSLANLQLERRHSLIDPAPVIDGFEKISRDFLKDLSEIQQNQQKLTEHDPLKDKIEALFEGRVGTGPKEQKTIDELYKTAQARYLNKIPPGYSDAAKDKKSPDEYCFGGITYKRKYGDYVVWSQLLSHAKEHGIKTLVFVTDDSKEDWWWKIVVDGPKILGPRPELLEEAHRIGKISSFLMYKPEGFLTYSKEFLEADVSTETLEEVRDVSRVRSARINQHQEFMRDVKNTEQSIYSWLTQKFSKVDQNKRGFPDFVAIEEGRKFGFEVKLVRNSQVIAHRLHDLVYRAYYEVLEGNLDMLTLVWVSNSRSEAQEIVSLLRRRRLDKMPKQVRNIVGILTSDDEESEFIPLNEFSFNELDGNDDLFS